MIRALGIAVVVAVVLMAPAVAHRTASVQQRTVRELTSDLGAADPSARARAACELKDHGDAAAGALQPLIALLADGAPIDASVCARRWWRGNLDTLTTPGEIAAATLVAIGGKAFDPLMATLRHSTWIARRNAAWALGALDDRRAAAAVMQALKDAEPAVREQAAWALGALDDRSAVAALVAALDDGDPRVRRQAAWALGALDDAAAVDRLLNALRDQDSGVRQQAAWALGAIGDTRAIPALLPVLKDPDASVRRQVAWAIGAIGR
jgi:HEAT repeat protein